MKMQSSLAVVDDLARLAGTTEPPALDDASARRMVDRAMRAPTAAPAASQRRSLSWPLAAAAFACIALALFAWSSRVAPRTVDAAPSHVTLPTGDRLVGTAGARFEIEELAPTSRRIRLRAGAMVFDVVHVAAGQRFEVTTDDAVAIATGTVFSVAVTQGATRVHVFEGSVAVVHGGERDQIRAGDSWSSSATAPEPHAITAAGDAFARERADAPTHTAPTPVVPAPPAAAADTATAPADLAIAASTTKAVSLHATESHAEPSASNASSASVPTTVAAPPAAALPASIDSARSSIAAGRYTEALTMAAATSRTGAAGEWDLVEGDALRALGRTTDAAAAFESAARDLPSPASLEAAYSAAYIRFHDLHAGETARTDLGTADDRGSPVEERALVLRVEILVSLGHSEEATVFAARYLDRFPAGTDASHMRALVSKTRH